MPIEVAPNNIELDRLDGGFAPDTPEMAVPANASPDVLNLLPEPGTGHPETRKGFERLLAGRLASLTSTIKNLYYYETIQAGARLRYLVAILSTGAAGTDNVQLWAYDLTGDTFTRIDDTGRAWENPKAPHWSFVVGGTYYGGVRGDAIYSWNPTDGWQDDPTSPFEPKTWVDAINDDVDPDTEFARDYAFKKRQKITYGDETYSALRDIRYEKWNDTEQYKIGDRVTRRRVWASTSAYPKSFECIRSHHAETYNAPGSGGNWRTYWKKVRLDDVFDEDDVLTEDWTSGNNGMKSSVGNFYGDRAFIRRDNEDDRSKLQYSAPLTLEKDVKIPDAVWDPTDWAAVDDIDGEGGGWLPFSGGRGDAIRGLWDMGNYEVVAKRWGTWVIAGRSEASWSVRKLGAYGVVALNCLTELDGLAYGLSHTGTLWVSDGTSQKEVPGYEKAREFIKERIDRLLQVTPEDDDEHWMPQVWEYDSKVWIALPDTEAASPADDITMVYDPKTESWWKLDLPILTATTGAKDRARRMWFATAARGSEVPVVFEYGDDPGDLVFTDDDPAGGASTLTTAIPWHYRTSWFQFGLRHNERRIRRAWALVRSAVAITLKGYRDFSTTPVYTQVRSASSDEAAFYEGKALGRVTNATALEVSGAAATEGPVLIGIGVDTEPVRTRFHRNSS
jgi:hypothetical protein